MTLILSAIETEGLVSMPEAIEAIENGFKEYFRGKCEAPVRMNVYAPERGGRYILLPCYLADSGIFHTKVFSVYPDNPKRDLPTNYYYYFLHDIDTGEIKAIMGGSYITNLRTGAVPGIATKYLARKDSCILALFGTGPVAEYQLLAMITVARLGGSVLTETTPLISSSIAKEETLADMIKVVSQYANIIVIRHPDADEATEAVAYADCPVICGAFGHREHPTQALLDLYTLWRTYGRVEGLKVCVATPDLVAARTGHSMALGLARLGAKVYLASTKAQRIPGEIMDKIKKFNGHVEEAFDMNQGQFNDFISDMDEVYLPGCSAPKGGEAEAWKKLMDDYLVRYETVMKSLKEKNKVIYVTHTLPRRPGEMDLRIDTSPGELYFKAIAYSVSIRMALVLAMIGL
jgi:aspartate carbamoyltransferase catalytic subunit